MTTLHVSDLISSKFSLRLSQNTIFKVLAHVPLERGAALFEIDIYIKSVLFSFKKGTSFISCFKITTIINKSNGNSTLCPA